MTIVLSKEGYCVTDIASTGEEAVEIALKNQPDLILMDIRLRGKMDGITAYEQIKKTIDIPVIFVSDYADENIIARVTLCNPSGFIVKPFKIVQLIKEVGKALEWHRLPQDTVD
jgi:CheY-like chemotaxis protein